MNVLIDRIYMLIICYPIVIHKFIQIYEISKCLPCNWKLNIFCKFDVETYSLHMGKREGIIRDSDQMLLEQFTAYFRLYENPLYNFALKTVQSEILARDIIQEVFIKLWSIRERFSQIDNMEDYLYRMVRNKVMDVLRQLANDRKLRTEYFNGHQWEDTNVYDTIVLKEYEVALSEAVSQLPPQRRIIYQLSHVEGKSRKEIASKLNISPSTVKNQLTAAMAYLRSVIKDHVKLF